MSNQKYTPAEFAGITGITTAGNIVNAGFNQMFAEHNRERNFYWNEKAANNADARQRRQFKDLYSYPAQLKQMKEAGLSPSMMFGGSPSQGGATAPQGLGAGGINTSPMSIIDPLTTAQIANINADTELKEAQATNTDKDTELKGQEIINLMGEDKNNRARFRLINAEADLAELEYSVNIQTAQATIRQAYSNAEKAANQARSAAVKADLDEATFDCAYQMAYANLNNTLSDTALKNSEISLNKSQIKEIAERIRNSQWETWSMEKEQNRKDAIFKFDQTKLKAEVEMWAKEQNIKLAIAEIEMVSDLVGYVCNFATCGLSNATQLKKTEMYTNTQKEIANRKQTTHTQNYTIDKKGNKVIRSGQYKETK